MTELSHGSRCAATLRSRSNISSTRSKRMSERPVNPRIGTSFIKQELAHLSNDQRFVYYEHVVISVMQFDDPRVFHA
jgi:hypothetical protein